MTRAARAAKKLAQRIELDYFKRRHPLRWWRFLLSVALPLACLTWLAWAGVSHDQRPYSRGPLASAHALFDRRCGVCHLTTPQGFRKTVADQACLSCHDGPLHQAQQRFTPPCASCHVEHQGRVLLAQTRDTSCTACHANLSTISGAPRFARSIPDFAHHPELAPLRAGFRDPGTIKLNHFVHLNPHLRGPNGQPVQLTCADCHRPPGSGELWRFGLAEKAAAAPSPAPGDAETPLATLSRAYMAPPKFAQTCIGCHPLLFDQRFEEPAPHDKPEVVHAFLVERFQEYTARHPVELHEPAETPRLPGKPILKARMLTREEWVKEQVAQAEKFLAQKTCKECHTLQVTPQGTIAAVAPSAITARWLPHAVFDHDAHRLVTCLACHPSAATSRETADVLQPGVRVCQQCHRTGSQFAEARCFECHTYHNWGHEKQRQAPYGISALTSSLQFAARHWISPSLLSR